MKNIINKIFILLFSFTFILGCEREVSVEIPEKVILKSPLQNQICELGVEYEENTSRVLFEWERAKNAQLYDLIVTNLNTGENYITYTDIFDNFKELVLENNTPYSYQVISKNASTPITGASDIWNFYFVGEPQSNYAPFPANIISPKQGTVVTASNGNVTLKWQGLDPDFNDLTFNVYFDQVDGKQPLVENLSNLTTNSVTVAVQAGSTYFWRVQTKDDLGNSFTQVYNFTVQ